MDYGNILERIPHKLRYITIPLSLFIFAFIIRLSGGMWDTRVGNDAYMSRQAEYIYIYGHPAVPDPFSSAPLYQPGMAYLLAFAGKLFDFIPIGMSSMTLAEGLIPPFLGAATVLVIFWLGSRFYNLKAGLIPYFERSYKTSPSSIVFCCHHKFSNKILESAILQNRLQSKCSKKSHLI